jgi:hypothetical protein
MWVLRNLEAAKGTLVLVLAGPLFSFSALAAAGSVEGTVVDQNGNAARAVTVNIDRIDGAGRYHVKPDKQGRFLHMGLPVGNYLITVTGRDHRTLMQIDGVHVNAGEVRDLAVLTISATPGDKRSKEVLPAQEPIASGCVMARDIYEVSGGSYLLQGTILQRNVPHLEAKIVNSCLSVVSVSVIIAYYDRSGTQTDTQFESATIAPGTQFALVHLLKCAKYGTDCTPAEWTTRIRILQVRWYVQ